MKWLIILVLVLVLIAIIAYRFRKQLQTVYLMWLTIRRLRKQVKPAQKQVPKRDTAKDTPLVRCSKCDKWTPQDEAVKLKSNFYCSHTCMEESLILKS